MEEIEIYDNFTLKKIIYKKKINHSIILRGQKIDDLYDLEVVNGSLGLINVNLQTLNNLQEIKGDFWISQGTSILLLSLDKLKVIKGDVRLRYSNLNSLGDLEFVGGNLNIRDTKIKSLEQLKFVGKDLFLPDNLKLPIYYSHIKIGGKLKFWKQIERQDITDLSNNLKNKLNYDNIIELKSYIYSYDDLNKLDSNQYSFYIYFKEKVKDNIFINVYDNTSYLYLYIYEELNNINFNDYNLNTFSKLECLYNNYLEIKIFTITQIVNLLIANGLILEAWEYLKKTKTYYFNDVLKLSNLIENEIFDADVLIHLAPLSLMTDFGKENVHNMKQFINLELERLCSKYKCKFVNIFFDRFNLPYINNNDDLSNDIKLSYDSNYYVQFYQRKNLIEYYLNLDNLKLQKFNIIDSKLLVENSVTEVYLLILYNAENFYRESLKLPKIGEGWISETSLYYLLKEYYFNEEVKHHASPNWLGRQHLDIYFTKYNIAIEYQGAQHYKPIDFFGGDEAYQKTIERDKRKKILCKENNCILILVNEKYIFNDLIALLNMIIENKKYLITIKT